MSWLKTIWREFFGIFVDDGSLALAIVAWLVVLRLLLPRLSLPPLAPAAILMAGLLGILVESVLRRARRHHRAAKGKES